MKVQRIALTLIIPVAALCLTTGCPRKSNVPLTKLQKPAIVSAPEAPPAVPTAPPLEPPPAPPVATPVAPVQSTDRLPTAEIDLDKYIQDRATLAADTVHFKFDSAVVQDSEQAHLTSVAQALSDPNLKLLVEGHCDERGTEEYNRSLGERRALALREALNKLGVDSMRIKTLSFGKDKPLDPGHDDAAWAKNRRGEFVVLHPKTVAP